MLRSGDFSGVEFDPEAVKQANPGNDPEITQKIIAVALFGYVDDLNRNRTLNSPEKSLQLFEFLHENHPEWAKGCWRQVKDLFVRYRRYDLAAVYMKDVYKEYLHIKRLLLKHRTEHDRETDAARSAIVSNARELINIAESSKHYDKARKIADDVHSLYPEINLQVKSDETDSESTEETK